ncbi:chorion peroxidase-like [Lingula anatina]|uniref:Chorion peroxidase-like n=1 Tax=Lingula anatina TaxID=7574 RepID=A0A1S3KI54_LINAN|nr:chorion peroxidase-like [Lingula anatina]|eukprot:XP_013422154.2 chorion peroxidase-like [Lingula anatina]
MLRFLLASALCVLLCRLQGGESNVWYEEKCPTVEKVTTLPPLISPAYLRKVLNKLNASTILAAAAEARERLLQEENTQRRMRNGGESNVWYEEKCPTVEKVTTLPPLISPAYLRKVLNKLNASTILAAAAEARERLLQEENTQRRMRNGGIDFVKQGAAGMHGTATRSFREASRINPKGYLFETVTKIVANRLGLTALEASSVSHLDIMSGFRDTLQDFLTALGMDCPFDLQRRCDQRAKYRSFDGSCNNLKKPNWGKSFEPFKRFLHPMYEDGRSCAVGVNTERSKGRFGVPLPNPRAVSSSIHEGSNTTLNSKSHTRLLMLFGQFLDHDLTHTPVPKGINGSEINCCADDVLEHNRNVRIPREELASLLRKRSECMPIDIPTGDRRFRRSCMNFIRSLPTPNDKCELGYREQLNQVTSYIDASQVYGSTEEQARNLRAFSGGLLKTSVVNGKMFMPKDNSNQEKECVTPANKPEIKCFIAGDERSNEQLTLTMIHTMFVREHNRIATTLQRYNPHWDDERTYQETRRIVGAMLQHITYSMWLPMVLGHRGVDCFEVGVGTSGYFKGYNENIDPSIRNAFAAAGFRFGHSLVMEHIARYGRGYTPLPSIPLKNAFFKPEELYNSEQGGMESIARGIFKDPMEQCDRHLTPAVTDHLFEDPHSRIALDLAALNIQRGRDHALPPYNDWRHWCGLPKARHFFTSKDGLVNMDDVTAKKISEIYNHPDDIDLFTGGMAELPVPGGIVGPTFACILGRQFAALKFGDRFFYENGDEDIRFTEDQLEELRKTDMARLFCDNFNIASIPRNVFLMSDDTTNPLVDCRTVKSMDLRRWIERRNVCRDGQWSSWSDWRCIRCDQHNRIRMRVRRCDNPSPSSCGKNCEGSSIEVRRFDLINDSPLPANFENLSEAQRYNYVLTRRYN